MNLVVNFVSYEAWRKERRRVTRMLSSQPETEGLPRRKGSLLRALPPRVFLHQ